MYMSAEHRKRFEEISKIYDKIIEKYKENKMAKEMTVAEIAKALGYEVKVVKEQPKPEPYQFKAGDVVQIDYYAGENAVRLIVEPVYAKGLIAVDIYGLRCSTDGGTNFNGCSYKKVGELKAFLVK